jgi:hypothetical protein
MTNTTSLATQIAKQVASRYEGLKFAPLDRKADRSRNHQRGARKSTRATRTIL